MEERIYTINLKDAFAHTRSKRAERAISEIRKYLKRHTKKERLSISNAISKAVYSMGYKKCPRKIKVTVHIEGDVAKAYLFGEEIKKEELKEEKKEEPKKEELKPAEAESAKDQKEAKEQK